MQQALPYLKRGERIAFLCPTKEIFYQSAERIMKRLDLTDKDIGMLGDGKTNIKNKRIVFIMVPTLNSALQDPRKGVKFTPKENIIRHIAEQVVPKFQTGTNTRVLLRNYITNCKLTTQVWKSAEEALMYIAYDKKFTDKTARMQLNKYTVELNKIIEKKNEKKYKRFNEVQELMQLVKVVIGDEIHAIQADTWMKSFEECTNASIRIGLSGTIDKKNTMLWQRAQAIFNQVISKVTNEQLISRGVSSTPIIRMVPIENPKTLEMENVYLEVYKKGIVENDYRNDVIAKLVGGYISRKPGGVLVSVNHIEHGKRIQELLTGLGLASEFTHGELDPEDRASYLERFSTGDTRVLIASSILDQGVDIKSIGCLVMASGGKSMRQNLQRIGRGLRLNGIDGNKVMVFDFVDKTNKFLLNHSKGRMKIYKEEKFDVRILGE